jgi:flagellar hook assembly protein FlgD
VASEPAAYIPDQFAIEAIYPNPFAAGVGEMRFTFRVAETGQVQIAVYDVLGRKVAGLVDENLASGSYEAAWNGKSADGRRISAGTYFVRMRAEDFEQTRNITVVH